jgi:hypothetical protein
MRRRALERHTTVVARRRISARVPFARDDHGSGRIHSRSVKAGLLGSGWLRPVGAKPHFV